MRSFHLGLGVFFLLACSTEPSPNLELSRVPEATGPSDALSGNGNGSSGSSGQLTPDDDASGSSPANSGGEGPGDLELSNATGSETQSPPGVADSDAEPPNSARQITRLGEGWRFARQPIAQAQATAFDDTQAPWQTVNVPHTYNAPDGQDGGDDYYRGITWYRHHFVQNALPAGHRLYVEFDAANAHAEVFVNGVHLGEHLGGYSRFRFDASEAVIAGENLLAVRVDNSPLNIAPLSADYTFFGGLYREVHLVEVDALHIDLDDFGSPGIYLDATEVSRESATVTARVPVTNSGLENELVALKLALLQADGSLAAEYTAEASVLAGQTLEVPVGGTLVTPHLWDGKRDPYLYTARVSLSRSGGESQPLVDSLDQPLGIRFFELDANTGFSLNGQYLDLHGVNRHQDRLDLSWAIGNTEHEQNMALIEEIGATALRLAHYQHSQYSYDLADRAGLVTWAEIPLVNAFSTDAGFSDSTLLQMRELIRQSYNPPSIVLWGIGNELRTDDAPSNQLLAKLAQLTQQEDTSRLSVYAHCCNPNTSALTRHTDAVGDNYYYTYNPAPTRS